jgi:putative ABC transport system permease protein
MWRVIGKSVMAHKGRLLRTAIAVMLGVAFVSGTYVLTDTLSHLFDNVMTDATAGVDVYVRGHSAFVNQMTADVDREPVPQSLLPKVLVVPGVAHAEGSVGGPAQFIGKDGKAIVNSGAPTFGVSWTDPPLSSARVREGRAPQNDSEVAIDVATARRYGFHVGDRIGILLNGPVQNFQVVGLVGLGDSDNIAGATMAVFDLSTAQRVLNKVGVYDSIEVGAAPGTGVKELQASIQRILPKGYEAVPRGRVAQESAQSIKNFLGFFKAALLVFALIALFVGAFTIYNTFSILGAQRTREFALLRSLGASPRQILASITGEALVVGLVASILGIGLGIVLAAGLQVLLKAIGLELPSSGMVFLARTLIVSLVLGVGMTFVSALGPARKAARVAPLAAVREVSGTRAGHLRRRTVTGVVLTAGGVGALLEGLYGHVWNGLALVGLGALLVFLGIAALSPIVARPVATLIGSPVARLTGVSGQLARENARRNAKRTATTAAALMVGVALIAFISIFTASIKASASRGLDEAMKADYVVTNAQQLGPVRPFTHDVAVRLIQLPEVGTLSAVRTGEWRYRGSTKMLAAVDAWTFGNLVDLDIAKGRLQDLEKTGVLVSENAARVMGVKVGNSIPMEFGRTGVNLFRVVGIYRNTAADANADFVISLFDFQRNFTETQDSFVYVKGASGVPLSDLRRAIESVTARYPSVKVQSEAELKASQQQAIDRLMSLITALLGLAVIIALVGIANTLGLSVMERTRELGLLRAVGMTRRQTRSMVRWEAVIITLLGAALGLVVGVFFGWAVVTALHDQGITVLALPGIQLMVYMVVAGFAGVAAALMPARRAARLDVLSAIAAE